LEITRGGEEIRSDQLFGVLNPDPLSILASKGRPPSVAQQSQPLTIRRISPLPHITAPSARTPPPSKVFTRVRGAEKGWGLEILSVNDYDPHVTGIFDILTPKQKTILLESYHEGYFDHPRRINAGELAEKMGMPKTTLLAHIHKAEKRLIGHILAQVA
jgi:hypothetical protein